MIKGSYVALVTPFKNNKIDYDSLEKLIEFQIENNTDGILLCGTTGEAPSFSEIEKNELLTFCIKKIDNRVPVMVGTGTNNLEKTIDATNKAKKLGADSALIITPYYNKPTQNGMYHYFKEVATKCDIPIVIYNVPSRTGINIQAETTLRLAHEFENIVAIKEASGDIFQASKIIKDAPELFSVMSGEDALNFPLMACGAKGAISVTANILPDRVHQLIISCLINRYDMARHYHQELLAINKILFIETNPIPVKEALNLMGMIDLEFRLPLFKLSNDNRDKLKKCLETYSLI